MVRKEFTSQEFKEGIYSSLIAGAVMMAMEMVLVPLALNGSVWTPPRMVAAILLDRDAVNPPVFNFWIVRLGLEIHFSLSIFFTFILIPFIRNTRLWITVVLGMLYGVLIYFINYYLFAYSLFPWFANVRDWVSIVSHLGFGVTVALSYKEFQYRDIGHYCVNC
jgi:hypothetical protein